MDRGLDLSLVPFDDLVAEINERFDTVIIGTIKVLDDNTDDMDWRIKGGKLTAIGLAEFIKKEAMEQLRNV